MVVITIIGILIALLLPAVQAAREAARQVQCRNNLKQLALACLSHEQATGHFPTNGWGYGCTGDADRNSDWRQPGGWLYNTLPYVEQQALHDLGMGLPQTQKWAAHLLRMQTPLSVWMCPTRRPALLYPWNDRSGTNRNYAAADGSSVSRCDYAANGGDYLTGPFAPHAVWNTPEYGAGPLYYTEVENPPGQMTANARTTFANIGRLATGVIYTGSMTKMADISDGTSNTYLAGEKNIRPDDYLTGADPADNGSPLQGENPDITRYGTYRYPIVNADTDWLPPLPDTPGYYYVYGFGSAHANGFHIAMCDGSVDMKSYSIDREVHRRLCNRKDGLTIDAKSY